MSTLEHIFPKYSCKIRTLKAFLKTNFLVIFPSTGVCVCVYTHTQKVACDGVHYKSKHLVILYNIAFFVNKMLRWTELSLFFKSDFCNFANMFSHFGIFRRGPKARVFNFMYPSVPPQDEMKRGLCRLFLSFTQ